MWLVDQRSTSSDAFGIPSDEDAEEVLLLFDPPFEIGRNPEGIARGRPLVDSHIRRTFPRCFVVPARTPPGHRAGGAAAVAERTDWRGQGGLFPANLVDSARRIAKFSCHPAVRRSGRAVDRRRRRAATISRQGGFETMSGLPKPARKKSRSSINAPCSRRFAKLPMRWLDTGKARRSDSSNRS